MSALGAISINDRAFIGIKPGQAYFTPASGNSKELLCAIWEVRNGQNSFSYSKLIDDVAVKKNKGW